MDRFGPLHDPPEGGTFPIIDPRLGSPFSESDEPASGGAGLVSTLRDYMRFACMLRGGGRLRTKRTTRPLAFHSSEGNPALKCAYGTQAKGSGPVAGSSLSLFTVAYRAIGTTAAVAPVAPSSAS